MEDRRNVGQNSCNSGDGTDQTATILHVYDYDDDDLFKSLYPLNDQVDIQMLTRGL